MKLAACNPPSNTEDERQDCIFSQSEDYQQNNGDLFLTDYNELALLEELIKVEKQIQMDPEKAKEGGNFFHQM